MKLYIIKKDTQFYFFCPVFSVHYIGLETEKLKELGAYSFLQKPFSMDDLEKILNEIRKKK